MASSGERRLLFDTRGKRKHVIRVVYAILALLMGASLFLVVGPVNIGALLGNQSSGSSAATVLDEQAERIERRLAKDPTDEALLLSLTRARIGAGNALIEPGAAGEAPTVPTATHNDFEAALQSWNRYLKQAGDEPNAAAAQLVASSFFRLAESGSRSLKEIQSNLENAAAAQRIAADQQPTLGSLSSLAIYEYFNGNLAAGDKATRGAAARAPAKAEAKNIEKQLAEYRKRAKKFNQGVEKAAKLEQKSGKEQKSQNPFGGLGGPPGSAPGE
jgi:hypothetical protein